MQESSSSLASLRSRKLKFVSAQPRKFVTNYYEINLNNKNSMIYQYSYSVNPEIENDSSRKLQKIIRNVWKELKDKIGLIATRGNNLYGTKDYKNLATQLSRIVNEQQDTTYQILIKKVKDLPINQMVNSSSFQQTCIAMQIINIDTKERLRKINLIQMDKGKYYSNKKILNQNFQNGFYVLKGYNFTTEKLKLGLCLHVELFSRIIRQRNVLQQIQNLSADQARALLKDAIVITRYGNFRTYRVLDIDYQKSPKSTFVPKNTNEQVTYVDYYEHNYDTKIKIMKQPLLHIIIKIQKIKRKGDIPEKVIHEGYLIPELVSLVGISQQHRSNGLLMKQLSSRTMISVGERAKQSNSQVESLNGTEGLYEIGQVKVVPGYQLEQPTIQTKRLFKASNGQIKLQKQHIKQPAQFNNWYFVVHKNHYNQAMELQKALNVASKAFGIELQKSFFYKMEDTKAQYWKEEIQEQFQYLAEQKQAIPQIVMVLIGGPLKDSIYHEIKNLCTTKLKVCTQFTTASKVATMNKKNQLLSYASNIILQMNAKVGKPLWEIPLRNPHLQKKSLMVGAIAVSKNGPSYSLGFVGTTNPKLSRVYNQTRIKKKRNQFDSTLLTKIFSNWLRIYFQSNGRKGLPDIIVFYREGLTSTQVQKNVKVQIESLQAAISDAKVKTKLPSYNPEIVYMSVNKRSSARFYQQTTHNIQKFAPKYQNPLSGSVVVDQFSTQNSTNFNLVSTSVAPNTSCSPTQFTLHYHNPKRTPEQAFIELSFEQSFNYYNWKGAVKVPACLQNADRLAKQAGKSLKSDITNESEMSKLYHFL